MADIEALKETEGLLSYIECRDNGEVIDAEGRESLELPVITTSFIQLGEMLGQKLGNETLVEVCIKDVGLSARFLRDGEKLVGIEYAEA